MFAGAEGFYCEGLMEGSGDAEIDSIDGGIEEDFGEAAEGAEGGEVHLIFEAGHVAGDGGEIALELIVVA